MKSDVIVVGKTKGALLISDEYTKMISKYTGLQLLKLRRTTTLASETQIENALNKRNHLKKKELVNDLFMPCHLGIEFDSIMFSE